MRTRYDEIRRLGAEVVVVSFEPEGRLPAYRSLHEWPFPVVSDPERAAYRDLGLESAGWGELLRPRVVGGYARLILRGYRPRATGADVHQLGGDAVVDPDRRLVYLHRSADPADRPPVEEIIRAIRRCGPAAEG